MALVVFRVVKALTLRYARHVLDVEVPLIFWALLQTVLVLVFIKRACLAAETLFVLVVIGRLVVPARHAAANEFPPQSIVRDLVGAEHFIVSAVKAVLRGELHFCLLYIYGYILVEVALTISKALREVVGDLAVGAAVLVRYSAYYFLTNCA